MEYFQTLIGPEKEGMNVLDYYFHVFAFRFPWELCIYGVLIATIFALILSVLSRKNKAVVFVSLYILWALFMILYFTVVSRSVWTEYELRAPLWSLREVINGNVGVIYEKTLNTLLFVPLGGFLDIEMFYIRRCLGARWSQWALATVLCFMMSVIVEILQLMTRRGICEVDDVMWNTFGALIGVALANVMTVLVTGVRRLMCKKD